MKLLITDYSFTVSNSRVTFNAFNSIELERILLITNVTTGQIIFNFADPAKGGTVTSNYVTLETSLAGMTDAHDLQIFYDGDNYKATIDKSDPTTLYIGKAVPGILSSEAKWQIKRLVTSSTAVTTTFADGNWNFDNIWDNRTSLSYS